MRPRLPEPVILIFGHTLTFKSNHEQSLEPLQEMFFHPQSSFLYFGGNDGLRGVAKIRFFLLRVFFGFELNISLNIWFGN